jgi:hypothetical protein
MAELITVDVAGLSNETVADIYAHVRGMQNGFDTYQAPPHGWTCFHCGETFRTAQGARLHFGTPVDVRPVCVAAE